jgi:hypothetical protein
MVEWWFENKSQDKLIQAPQKTLGIAGKKNWGYCFKNYWRRFDWNVVKTVASGYDSFKRYVQSRLKMLTYDANKFIYVSSKTIIYIKYYSEWWCSVLVNPSCK